MTKFIIGIISIIVGIVCLIIRGRKKDEDGDICTPWVIKMCAGAGLPIIGAILIVCSCVRTVPTGNTGIVTTFGRVEDYTYEAGMHFTAPWHSVINMDNRTQRQTIDMSCFSSDIQEVTLVYTINYQINKQNAQDIYKTIGTDYYNIIILPKTLEAVKGVIAKYNAESLVASRGSLSVQIEDILTEQLASANIELVSTSLENLDFTDTFTNAVEAKQVAEQNKLRVQTEQEQAIIEAEAAAEVKRIQAQAEADALLIEAQNDVEVQKLAADASEYAGQKQASINERIASSLTLELNQYYLIEAWKNGADVPTTILGDSSITGMFDITQ